MHALYAIPLLPMLSAIFLTLAYCIEKHHAKLRKSADGLDVWLTVAAFVAGMAALVVSV